jgi:hypothetical protein
MAGAFVSGVAQTGLADRDTSYLRTTTIRFRDIDATFRCCSLCRMPNRLLRKLASFNGLQYLLSENAAASRFLQCDCCPFVAFICLPAFGLNKGCLITTSFHRDLSSSCMAAGRFCPTSSASCYPSLPRLRQSHQSIRDNTTTPTLLDTSPQCYKLPPTSLGREAPLW